MIANMFMHPNARHPAYTLPRLLSFLIIGIAAVLTALASTNAHAHKPSDSYLTLTAQANNNDVAVRWDISLRDLDYVLQLDRDNDGTLTWGEVRSRGDDIAKYASSNLQLSNAEKPCALTNTAPMQLDHHSDGTYAVLSLNASCGAPISEALQIKYALLFDVDPSHRGLVQWIPPSQPAKDGQESAAMSFVLATETATQNLPMQAPSQWQSFKQYVIEGVWHIWIGFDHILFLLSLLLPAVLVFNRNNAVKHLQAAPSFWGAFKEVLKVVTAFTLAHSITLTLAALGYVSLPSRLVESVIAASIVVAAISNIRANLDTKRWVMAFGFGLIHGFGFASVLADLGLPSHALVTALIGFNVGVELGQLAIVAVFLPIAFWLRHTKFYQVGVFKWGSVLIALMALYWFVQRAFDL